MKKIIFILTLVVIISVIFFLLINNRQSTTDSTKTRIVTTLFPLFDIAKNLSGDKMEVTLLLPPGIEPHSFEPKPSDIAKINSAVIFIYTGKLMEPWVGDIIKSLDNKNLIVVDASRGITMIPGVFYDADKPVGSIDPHIWLDFDNLNIMVKNIQSALISKDVANSLSYNQAAEAYLKQLAELDNEYKGVLANCQSREIVYAGHYAFGYLAKRYDLKYLAAQGVSPDAEPTVNDLIKLVEQVKTSGIKYIFYEELASPKIAETLALETGTKLLLLNAAHNVTKDQLQQNLTFIDILKSNLANLKIGLLCYGTNN